MMRVMNKYEQEQWKKQLGEQQWNIAFTITGYDEDSSPWLSALELLNRLKEVEPEAEGVFFVSAVGRYHGHGMLRTKKSQAGVKKLSNGCFFNSNQLYDVPRWIDYIVKQAAADAVLNTLTTEDVYA